MMLDAQTFESADPAGSLAIHDDDVFAPQELAVPAAGTALATSAVDGEWISRESRIQTLELQAVHCRDDYVRSTMELGQVLVEHRDLCRENGQRFTDLCDRIGLTHSHAYALTRVATACAQLPRLKDLADRQFSTVLTLIQGTDDDLLRQIANGEQAELQLDDAAKMSVRQLRERVRLLTEDQEHVARKQTKVFKAERDALIKERDRLAALTGDDLDAVRRTVRVYREQTAAATGTLTALYRQLEEVHFMEATSPRGQLLLDQIEGDLRAHVAGAQQLWATWTERRDQDWGHTNPTDAA